MTDTPSDVDQTGSEPAVLSVSGGGPREILSRMDKHVPPSFRRSQFGDARWDLIVPIATFLLLVLSGVTTSSIGVVSLLVNDSSPSRTVGDPLTIRSDEFLTTTPVRLGIASMGHAEQLNPLAADASFTVQSAIGPFSSVVFFDNTILQLGSILPMQMVFAFAWWLPFLLLSLGLPYMFSFLCGSRWPGWIAFALIVASPVDVWWSHQTVNMLGYIAAGSAALVKSCLWFEKRSAPKGTAWGLVSAVFLSRTPYQYQPWMLVLAPVVILMVIVPLLTDQRRWKKRLIVISAIAVFSLGLFGLSLMETREGFLASLNTVYPGSRKSGGGPVPIWLLFGAPQMSGFAAQDVVGSNHSEIASSYLILSIASLLVVLSGHKFKTRALKSAWLVSAFGTGFWFTWSVMNFGSVGESLPLISLVPPARSAAMVGILATLMFALTIEGALPSRGFNPPLLAAFLGFTLTGYAGSEFQATTVPELSTRHVVATSLVVSVLLFCLMKWPKSPAIYGSLIVASFAVVYAVNPLQMGLGDLKDSELAKALQVEGRRARDEGEVWATDSFVSMDSLLTANAVPSLSSRQMAGPDSSSWQLLDPQGIQEETWNRGGSFITFVWSDDLAATIENPQADIIRVTVSPCALGDAFNDLTTVVSTYPLNHDCLVPNTALPGGEDGVIEFGNGEQFVYDLVR